jgi:hypothetical protein
MFANFFKFTKRTYCTSLKDKKSKIILTKTLEKVMRQNESDLIKKEIESIYENINYGKLLIKLSLLTILPTTAYLIYSNIKYQKKTKLVTDAYNIALNGVVTSTTLFVYLNIKPIKIGTFIGLNYKSYKKFSKDIPLITMVFGILIFYLIFYQMYEADKMNLKHIFPLFVSYNQFFYFRTTGLFTAEYVYGKNLPGWYLKSRLTIMLIALIAFNFIVYSDVTGNSNLEKSIRLLNEYQTKSDELKETPQLINKNYI